MGERKGVPLEAHKYRFWAPDIPGHKQIQDNLHGRRMNKRLVEHMDIRTEALREELIEGYQSSEVIIFQASDLKKKAA